MNGAVEQLVLKSGTSTLQIVSHGDSNSWIAILVTIAVAILGWVISLILQKKNLMDQQRNQIRYDIYKQITKIHQEIQDPLNKLMLSSSLPFIMMDSCLIGVGSQKTQPQAMQDGWKYWMDYVQERTKDYFDFTSHYINFLFLIQDWGGPLKELDSTQKILTTEIQRLQNTLYPHLSDWQTITLKRGYDWTKWNRDEVQAEGQMINDDASSIQLYLSDFMILVHNNLMAEYFDYKRPTRRPMDKKYKVLTMKGFVDKDEIED